MSNQLTTGQIREIINSGDLERIALIGKEDLDIFYENENQRHLLSPDGTKNLYMAICEKAVDDYKAHHRITLFKNPKSSNIKSREEKMLEEFFGSDFFLNVTGLRSREHTIQEIESTMIADRKRKLNLAMVKAQT